MFFKNREKKVKIKVNKRELRWILWWYQDTKDASENWCEDLIDFYDKLKKIYDESFDD